MDRTLSSELTFPSVSEGIIVKNSMKTNRSVGTIYRHMDGFARLAQSNTLEILDWKWSNRIG